MEHPTLITTDENSYLFLSLADVLNRDTFKGKLYGFSTPEMNIKDALRNKEVFLGQPPQV